MPPLIDALNKFVAITDGKEMATGVKLAKSKEF